MKKFLKNLWVCKNHVIVAWIFFFSLSECGHSKYNDITLALISLCISLIIVSYVIFLKKIEK